MLLIICRDFYPILFSLNPAISRLFDPTQMETQRYAFIKILRWIVANIENKDLPNTIENLGNTHHTTCTYTHAHTHTHHTPEQLGAKHEIYGVEEGEYALFSQAIAKVIQNILGEEMVLRLFIYIYLI
jgi:hemoglobin-like flavoprotein